MQCETSQFARVQMHLAVGHLLMEAWVDDHRPFWSVWNTAKLNHWHRSCVMHSSSLNFPTNHRNLLDVHLKKHSGWVLYYIWFYNILFLPVDLAGSIYGVTENLKMGSRAPSWQVAWWTLFTKTNGFMVLVDQDNHQWQIVFIIFLSFEDDVFGRYLAKN